MSRKRTSANNVRAGIFVLVCILGAFAIVVVLAGLREKIIPRDTYVVHFDLETGATGLEAGSIVRIAGVDVGRVKAIRLVTEGAAEPAGVYATIAIDRERRFYGEPVAFLERPLLGSGAELNFASVGDPASDDPLPEGGQIRGVIAPPAFLAGMGFGDEQKSQLQNVLANADKAVSDIQSVTGDARTRSKQWFDDADKIVANFRTASDEFPEITANVELRLDELRDFIARARAVIDDNRERIDTIVKNTESASKNLDDLLAGLNSETKDLLNGMLQDGRSAAASAQDSLDRVSTLLKEQSPSLRRAIANTRLASDQLKLTLEELRGSPWRLLYRPDTRELEFEYLYDAARAYAAAVSDLRSASESLESVSASMPGSAPEIAELLADLEKAFQTYTAAEQHFLKLVTEDAAPSGN